MIVGDCERHSVIPLGLFDNDKNLVLQMGFGRPRPPLSVDECRTYKYANLFCQNIRKWAR